MTTSDIPARPESLLQSSFENHRKVFAHLKAIEKYLVPTQPVKPIEIVPLNLLSK